MVIESWRDDAICNDGDEVDWNSWHAELAMAV